MQDYYILLSFTGQQNYEKNQSQLFFLKRIWLQPKTSTKQRMQNWGYAKGRRIDAEFSLQRASHNSRENNQRQSGSQIREI